MNKFLSSKLFIILSTLFTFILGAVAGTLLGFQPNATNSTGGGWFSNITETTYQFRIETAIGWWLIALIITFVVLLLCTIIRNQQLVISKTTHNNQSE